MQLKKYQSVDIWRKFFRFGWDIFQGKGVTNLMNTGQTERWMENIVSNTFYLDIIDRLTSSFLKLFINKTRRASTTRQDPQKLL